VHIADDDGAGLVVMGFVECLWGIHLLR